MRNHHRFPHRSHLIAAALAGAAPAAADTEARPVVVPNAESFAMTATGSGRHYRIFLARPSRPCAEAGCRSSTFLMAMPPSRPQPRRCASDPDPRTVWSRRQWWRSAPTPTSLSTSRPAISTIRRPPIRQCCASAAMVSPIRCSAAPMPFLISLPAAAMRIGGAVYRPTRSGPPSSGIRSAVILRSTPS